MKALILNGSPTPDAPDAAISAALCDQLQSRGWELEHILLREQKIGTCAGDFFCWIRSPGVCNTNDDNREIAAKIVECDLLILLSPVTFGSYGSTLKRMVDHLIQNVLPFFTHIDGEVHHQPRYARYPNMLAIGWMETPDAASEAIFRTLARRNALNMYARTSVCGVVTGSPSAGDLTTQIAGWLDAVARGDSSPVPALPSPSADPLAAGEPIRRAVLLVGSPRTAKSTSFALGGYLLEQLAGRGVETQTIQLYTTLSSPVKRQALFAALDSADLIVLAFPLYVDSLPAPVTAALEMIAAERAGKRSTQRFVAITNCGFPEAHHCDSALAVCKRFADQAGLTWAGGLALGGGGMINGTPLAQMGGRARYGRKALDMAAVALASGQAIPREAVDLMAKPNIPAWLYLLVAGLSWRQQAKPYGVQKQLRKPPYQKTAA
ncbi:NAD(P)H dehydrogenase [Chloroflexales bacterium ZM16-3]|nr:NAD(P)H dehydrogenase [Chloroflexales bacterium ZM16-3]